MKHALSPRIILIEPQELFLPYLVELLEASGVRVVAAVTRMSEAQINALNPDVILIDIPTDSVGSFQAKPKKTNSTLGFSRLGRLRKAAPRARLVAFGGLSTPAWRANAWAQGVDDLLTNHDDIIEFLAAAHRGALAPL
jgi:DNA-binding NarL/FixJ family response regulator